MKKMTQICGKMMIVLAITACLGSASTVITGKSSMAVYADENGSAPLTDRDIIAYLYSKGYNVSFVTPVRDNPQSWIAVLSDNSLLYVTVTEDGIVVSQDDVNV